MLQPDIIDGYDDGFHLARIESLAVAIQRGEFPVKLHKDLCYGFGYGVGFFCSNLFLYIPAALMVIGFSLEVSYKCFAILLFIGMLLSMYIIVYRIVCDKYIAMMSAVLYLFSTNVLFAFYHGFSMGRCQAFVFLPFAIGGFYRVLKNNKDAILLGIGFTGLIYSHVLSTAVALMVCAAVAIVYIKDWITDIKKWKTLISTVVSVVLITAAYWLPFLEQVFSQKYRYSIPWTYVDENVMSLYDLITIRKNGIGVVLIALVILMGLWMVEKPKQKTLNVFFFLGLFFMLLPTVSVFWSMFREILDCNYRNGY